MSEVLLTGELCSGVLLCDIVSELDPKPPKPGMGGGYAPSFASAAPSHSRSSGGGKEYRIFVGSITSAVNDSDIQLHFSQFGDVTDVYRPGKQKASRDGAEFGFVIFENQQAMAKALAQPSHVVNGVELMVTRARERPAGGGSAPMVQQQAAPAAMAYDPALYAQYGYASQAAAQQVYNPYLTAPGYAQAQQQSYAQPDAYQAYPSTSRGKQSTRYQPY